MWLKSSVVAEVERLALVRYVSAAECKLWNEHRREGELRLFCGWMWAARRGGGYQGGLRTRSAALRDAWYQLVALERAPRPRLRLVARRAA